MNPSAEVRCASVKVVINTDAENKISELTAAAENQIWISSIQFIIKLVKYL